MPEAIIETAIGLLLVFVLMSLISSQLVEWVAAFRGWRAKDLESTIRTMLFEPKVKDQINTSALKLADALYEHPLIASLAKYGGKPSYIPADKFVVALFDVITTAGTETSTIARARAGLEQVRRQVALAKDAIPELDDLLQQIQQVANLAREAGQPADVIDGLSLPRLLTDQLMGFLKRNNIDWGAFNSVMQPFTQDGNDVVEQVISGAVRLAKDGPDLAQVVTSLLTGLDAQLAEKETRLARARKNFEQWFNDTMDRASGWYKRHTQFWLGVMGLLLALLLNVDTVTIATALWKDPILRQSVVAQAQNYHLSSATDAASADTTAVQATTAITNTEQAAQAIRNLSTQLSQDLRLPIGWRTEAYSLQPGEVCSLLPVQPNDVWGLPTATACLRLHEAVPNPEAGLLGKLIGWLITAIAVSQGAPFWFDMLQKLVNLRLAGKKPTTSDTNKE